MRRSRAAAAVSRPSQKIPVRAATAQPASPATVSAADAAGAIAKASAGKRGALRLGRAKSWLELNCGGDVTRIQPGSAPAYETVKVEGEERLRVWWTRPDNQVVALDVDNTETNRARLDADHEGKD